MSKWFRSFLLICVIALLGAGTMPVPDMSGVSIDAHIEYERAAESETNAGYFLYRYRLAMPPGAEGDVGRVGFDFWEEPPFETNYIGAPDDREFIVYKTPFYEQTYTDSIEELTNRHGARLRPFRIVPFGVSELGSAWNTRLNPQHFGVKAGELGAQPEPGETEQLIAIESPGLPAIHDAFVKPHWVYAEDPETGFDPQAQRRAAEIKEEIVEHRRVIGPSWVRWGTQAHWEQFLNDVEEAEQLGWLDSQKAAYWLERLSHARALRLGDSPWMAEDPLQIVMDDADQAIGSSEVDQAIAQLVFHNARVLLETLPDDAPRPAARQ